MLYYPPHLRHVATLPREIKNSNFLQMWKKTQTNCILIASNFVIHPQILIFSLFEITSLSPILIANKIVHVTVLLLVYFCHQLWHRKFVWADDTAAFVNNQHGIQQRGQDFDKKKFVFEPTRLTQEIPVKSWTKRVVLISCWKSCRTQAQLTGRSMKRKQPCLHRLNISDTLLTHKYT